MTPSNEVTPTPVPVEPTTPLPSGPTQQQNPALIADAMNHMIPAIGQIMLKRINDPTYIVANGTLALIRTCTLAIGDWSMQLIGVSAKCEIQSGGLDMPDVVVLTMNVYGRAWSYVITG